jgi:hypothetical protein
MENEGHHKGTFHRIISHTSCLSHTLLSALDASFVMLFVVFALTATAAAATEVSVVWRHEKPTNATSLTIYPGAERTTALAETCGNAIGYIDFSRVDEHGAGNFTVGEDVFDVFHEPSHGPSCTRMWNDHIAVVECSGVQFDVPANISQSPDCFSVDHAKHMFARLKNRSVDVLNAKKDPEHVSEPEGLQPSRLTSIMGGAMSRIAGRGLQKRATFSASVVGDGNPHQNYKHTQLTVS